MSEPTDLTAEEHKLVTDLLHHYLRVGVPVGMRYVLPPKGLTADNGRATAKTLLERLAA